MKLRIIWLDLGHLGPTPCDRRARRALTGVLVDDRSSKVMASAVDSTAVAGFGFNTGKARPERKDTSR